ncbi:MAG: META domain-containing protein [Ignavibacteria bacterium]|nr:META domain-containing protein [Ignavibacteria bacterium]
MFFSIRSFVLIILPLTLSACADTTNSDQKAGSLVGPEWVVESFREIDGTTTAPGTVALVVRFISPDTLSAKADNELWGRYTIQNGTLSITKLGGTKRGLSPGSREDDFMQALENATSYSIDGNKLSIYYFDKTRAINLLAN